MNKEERLHFYLGLGIGVGVGAVVVVATAPLWVPAAKVKLVQTTALKVVGLAMTAKLA